MIAKPSPKGFADLVPQPQPMEIPPKAFNNAKYVILYREWSGNSYSLHKNGKAMLIAYERHLGRGRECEVWDDRRRRVKLELRENPTRSQPKYKFARGGK